MNHPDHIDIFGTADSIPFDYIEKMRAAGPVLWDENLRGWVVLSYDLCRQILINEADFNHNYATIDDDTLEIKGGHNIVVSTGATHARLHSMAIKVFAPRNIEGLVRDHVQPVVDALIDRFEPGVPVDLREELCNQVPGRTMMSMMGMEWADDDMVQRLVDLHDCVISFCGRTRAASSDEEVEAAKEASRQLNEVLLPVVRDREVHRGSDLLSLLWNEAPAILDDCDEKAIVANAREFFLGGFDTTVHALSNGLYLLLSDPELRARVEADRGATLDAFGEEVLRVWGVIQNRTRIAARDLELGGRQIRAGDRIIPYLYAANRDPAKFGVCPGQIALDRPNPKEHLAFITGPRTCVAAPLARAEMRTVFTAVLDRLKGVRLADSGAAPAYRGAFTRSWCPLQVVFDALAPAAAPAEAPVEVEA